MVDETININLNATGSAKKNIEAVTKSVNALEKDVTKIGGTFKRIFEVAAGQVLGKAFTASVNQASKAVGQLFNTLVTDGVRAAQAQEDAIQQLNTALVTSGQFTQEASKDFQEYASALQQTTKFGDEVILENAALLQSLGQLSKEGLKEATKVSLDFAAALKIDLRSAVTLVGKAAVGEIGSLSRYGVIVKRGSDNAETFARTLKALNDQFGGAAAAQIQTFSGATEQLQNTFGDFTEEIGFLVTQNSAVISIVKELNTAFSELGKFINDNKDDFKALVTEGVLFFIEAVELAAIGIAAFAEKGRQSESVLSKIGKGFRALAGGEDVRKLVKEQEELEEKLEASAKKVDKLIELISTFKIKATNAAKEGAKGQDELNKKLEEQSKLRAEAIKIEKELAAEKAASAEAEKLLTSVGAGTGGTDPGAQLKAETENLQAQRDAQLITEAEFLEERRALIIDDEEKRIAIVDDGFNAGTLSEEKAANARLVITTKSAAAQNKIDKQVTKTKDDEQKKRAAAFKSSLSTIATLQSSSNKTLFRIGQAANIAQAISDGITAVNTALKAAPPPFNFALAAAVGAASAANVAKIASAKPPKLQGGLDEVPPGFSNDTFPALLSSGERVVPSETNKSLTEFLNGQQNTAPLLQEISAKLDAVANVNVNIGEDTVTTAVRRSLESGNTIEVEA